MEITKHLGYSEDPFELAFCKKKKKAHKSESNKDELELITNFQKLRIIDTFEHGKEKQQQETIMTPNLKKILQQSPLPKEVLDDDGEIDFNGILNTDPVISEEIAEDIIKDNGLNQPQIDNSTHRVVGVFEGVVDQVPLHELLPKGQDMNEEEESFFPDDDDQLINVESMATRNYILTSSNDESSDLNSNSENDGAYPSDDDSDKNFNHSDFDDDD